MRSWSRSFARSAISWFARPVHAKKLRKVYLKGVIRQMGYTHKESYAHYQVHLPQRKRAYPKKKGEIGNL